MHTESLGTLSGSLSHTCLGEVMGSEFEHFAPVSFSPASNIVALQIWNERAGRGSIRIRFISRTGEPNAWASSASADRVPIV